LATNLVLEFTSPNVIIEDKSKTKTKVLEMTKAHDWFLTEVNCGLIAKKTVSAQCPTLTFVIEHGTTCTLPILIS